MPMPMRVGARARPVVMRPCIISTPLLPPLSTKTQNPNPSRRRTPCGSRATATSTRTRRSTCPGSPSSVRACMCMHVCMRFWLGGPMLGEVCGRSHRLTPGPALSPRPRHLSRHHATAHLHIHHAFSPPPHVTAHLHLHRATGNHDHYGGHPEAQIEYYSQNVDPDARWVMPGE